MQPLIGTPWSMTFAGPVATDVSELVRELLGVPIAHDGQTFLFDSLTRLTQIGLTVMSSRAGHRPALALCQVGDVVALRDGELFRSTLIGWQRVGIGESKARQVVSAGSAPMTEREMMARARPCVRGELLRLERMAMNEERPDVRKLYEEVLERLHATLANIDAYLGIDGEDVP